MSQEVNEQWQVGVKLLSFTFWRIQWAAWDNSCCPSNWGSGRRLQSKKSAHQLNRIWTHADNLALLCFSSDQLRDVPVLYLPAGTAAAEAERVELLWLLLGKYHLVMKKYLHIQPHQNVQHWSVWRLCWSNLTHLIRKKKKKFQRQNTHPSFYTPCKNT